MYCSNCGIQAGGNFCSSCGERIGQPQEDAVIAATDDSWLHEIVYEKFIKHPVVRERIKLAGQQAQQELTGEQLLAVFDAVAPSGVSLEKLAVALLPVYERMGLKTGKKVALTLPAPAGQVLLALLCGLVRRGYEVEKVEQMADGCVITALMPSTIWTNRGKLIATVHCNTGAVHLHAATNIPGQLFDWGKSQRILSEIMAEIQQDIGSQANAVPPIRRNVA